MREVTAVGEVHREDGIAWGEQSEEHRHVCLCARMGLNIREVRAEEFLRAFDGDRFDHIDIFAATVITA